MPIPVVTIPQQGPIATRPRREGVYDTEGWDDGSAIDSRISIFRNAASFANTDLGLSKSKGRDHNFDNNAGQLPKGQALHWYSITNKIRPTGVRLADVANDLWDVIRRIREVTWWTFYFGQNPYIRQQTWAIPEGVGIGEIHTTRNANTVFYGSQCELSRHGAYDVTLSGMPVEITSLESFYVDIEASGVTPTPTVDLYDTVTLRGVHLRGLQG